MARLQDEHTERSEAEQEGRHRLLTQRDDIIGLDATSKATDKLRRASALRRATPPGLGEPSIEKPVREHQGAAPTARGPAA